jgi:hypothetical protein
MDPGYAQLVSNVGSVVVGMENAVNELDPRGVPEFLGEELPRLQALTQQLEQAECPAAANEAHERLIVGLRQFLDDLSDVLEDAMLEASQEDVYQRGLLWSSVAVTAGGGRMRWELSQSHGLAAVREALRELKTVN